VKLIINLPVYNEEESLAQTISRIKKSFQSDFYSSGKGKIISQKLIQIVDDGSTDQSVEEAKKAGADIIVSYKPNRRLAYAFKQATESALKHKADFMVNIDADGQFDPEDIPALLSPILKKEADIVIANRFGKIKAKDIPWIKSFLNQLAAKLIGSFLGVKTQDLTCGFRAHNTEALLKLNLTNLNFTYTQETIIDAIGKKLILKWIPVKVTYFKGRKGKITKSISKFVINGFKIILRAIRDVRPLKFFGWPGILFTLIGLFGFSVFLYHYFQTFKITPYLNYVIFSSITLLLGIQFLIFALVADMIKTNRQLTEEALYQNKKDRFLKNNNQKEK